MSWTCFLVGPNEDGEGGQDWERQQIGAMWKEHRYDGSIVWLISLPSNRVFASDTAERGGWTWTGTPPNVTIRPSINIPDGWHGFVTDGVISNGIA